ASMIRWPSPCPEKRHDSSSLAGITRVFPLVSCNCKLPVFSIPNAKSGGRLFVLLTPRSMKNEVEQVIPCHRCQNRAKHHHGEAHYHSIFAVVWKGDALMHQNEGIQGPSGQRKHSNIKHKKNPEHGT